MDTLSLSPEAIALAARMYDSARRGDLAVFQQALPAGLPPNMTNDKGDTLVRSSVSSLQCRQRMKAHHVSIS